MWRIGRVAALLCTCALASAAALAAKPPAAPRPFDPRSVRPMISPAAPASPAALCTLGESGDPVFIVNYILPPDDAYYVLLSAVRCAPCMPPDTSSLAEAFLALSFPVTCSIPVNVSIVGATGPESCRRPVPSNVLCPEQSMTLSPSQTGTTLFELPLPSACEIDGDAFLCIEFPSLPEDCDEFEKRPNLVTTNRCATCETYNFYPGGSDDLCAVLFPGRPIMYTGVDACVVPVLPHTWGSVKVVYR